jgi:hypothetical protein
MSIGQRGDVVRTPERARRWMSAISSIAVSNVVASAVSMRSSEPATMRGPQPYPVKSSVSSSSLIVPNTVGWLIL